MKRLILVLLAVLLLAGCSKKSAKKEAVNATEATSQPVPTGVYEADSEIEKQSGGALRVYNTTGVDVYAVKGGVAVLHDSGELTLLDTEMGKTLNTATGIAHVLAVGDTSVFYYDGSIRECALDGSANRAWVLPDGRVGDFAIGTKTREIYYCVQGQIRALHLDTGIDRMIKEHSMQHQNLTGAWFGGEVIGWETENGTSFLSAIDGRELSGADGLESMYTHEDLLMAYRVDGVTKQLVVGERTGDRKLLFVQEQELIPALALGGVVAVDDTEELRLSFYQIADGKKTAAVTVHGQAHCLAVAADQFVWILTSTALYRWDVSATPVSEETVYTGPVPTAEAPDEAAISQCQQRVDQMEKDYGVKIEIWQDAVAQTDNIPMDVEYQPQAINEMLDALEPHLMVFPDKFLRSTVKNGWVRICLVRHVDTPQGYTRFWAGKDCYIVIGYDADMAQAFYHGLGGAVDSHILGNSRDFEYWNDLNPDGFQYTYSDLLNPENAEFIPAFFVDEQAMVNPMEDRARIFYYAITQDNGHRFQDPAMQEKLKTLCLGIREAYDLQKSTDTYLWEQYLTDALAYVKE